MQLTATEFAKLINDLKCDVRSGERRTNPRAPTRAQLEVVPVPTADVPTNVGTKPKPQVMRVRDISRTGMGLLTATQLESGSRLVALLPKTSTETLLLLCEVVRAQRLPGDMYHVGAKMVRRLTAEEYARFLDGAADIAATLAAAA